MTAGNYRIIVLQAEGGKSSGFLSFDVCLMEDRFLPGAARPAQYTRRKQDDGFQQFQHALDGKS